MPKADAVNIIDITPNSSTLNPFEKKYTLIMLHEKITTLIIAANNAWPGRLPTTFLTRFIKILVFVRVSFGNATQMMTFFKGVPFLYDIKDFCPNTFSKYFGDSPSPGLITLIFSVVNSSPGSISFTT